MLNPPLNQLTSKVKSKYLIATVAAKRARELYDKPETALIENYHSVKTVGEALEEIADGKITPIEPELNESEFETKD
ncbi:DNA-directed RNA polymerase subunit omega [Staphylococcus sp. IVB6181]|uniref:DNA-directed RNA polymerase subunit omega n=1 Tax=Staphylococcus TaxID=1279 RepID=UPI000D035F2B|nr:MULTISPECIES: DNA-directed RNA polymerase subunit omega [Staphylococcus]MCD8914599.1 DNA-directed RNA polymerase subunit omega [Staphylococcus simulans]UXV34176.1 DNA-directed RNA polymerase subunit omega [Staphylococcus sp. IVB6181]